MMLTAQEPMIVVYRAVNRLNGHKYIGFTTKGLGYREKAHRWRARSGGYLLQAAMRKYGHEHFTFEILADFVDDEDMAKVYEWEMIAKWKPEYNISLGGDGGSVHPDTCKKISDANKGRPSPFKGIKKTEEAKAKMRAAKAGYPGPRTGIKASAETLLKMSLSAKGKPSPNKGKKASEETRQKISETRKGRSYPRTATQHAAWVDAVRRHHDAMKVPIKCLTDGRVFPSVGEVDKFYGFAKGATRRVVSGERRSTHGMHFMRATEDDLQQANR